MQILADDRLDEFVHRLHGNGGGSWGFHPPGSTTFRPSPISPDEGISQGIDGIIKEDKLGLDAVYIQAKRWEGKVGRPVVQAFAGSLEGQRARKGVLITTSGFSEDAKDYVGRIEKKIVLIDGRQLAELMMDHGVGVADVVTYTVKRLDLDYFEVGEELDA